MSITKNISFFLVLWCTIGSCTKKVVSDQTNKNEDSIICTDEFAEIKISIKDTDNNPVLLNRYEIILGGSDKNITASIEQYSTSEGIYTIINDSFKKELFDKETRLVFVGYSNNIKVTEEIYKVSADKCHIKYLSGKREVMINSFK